MFCKHCGKEISNVASFCKYCGRSVSKIGSQSNLAAPSEVKVREDKKLAGFWIRAGAFIFDYGLITIIWGVIWAFIEWPEYYDGITEYFLLFLYHSLFLSGISTTPGKKLFGLRVADASSGNDLTIGRAFGRTLSYALSSILLGLGFLHVAWHERKQGWHDLLAKTVVIRKQKKLLLPILSTLLLWTVLGGFAWYGDDTPYYSGLPGESIIKSLDEFLSDKPANFQELFYAGFGADKEIYEIEIASETQKEMTSQEIAKENQDTIVFIRTDEGIGSGFFISPDGLIATNYHVIANASQVGVQTSDGSQHLVTSVVDFDELQDFAIIKVDVSNASFVSLGDSDSVELGEDVVVIGNPEGLSNSVTRGIVSSILREIEGGEYIQIDAPISAGSSGGPIFNSRGQAIGIATLYLTEGQNLNFGIPINNIFDEVLVRSVVNDRSSVQVKEEAETSNDAAVLKPVSEQTRTSQQAIPVSRPVVDVPKVVEEEFRSVYGRNPTDAESEYWKDQFRNNSWSREQLRAEMTKEKPASAEKPKSGPTWNQITVVSGTASNVSSFNSHSFTIKGSQWRIRFSVDGSLVSVRPESTDPYSYCFQSFSPSGSGVHNVYCEPGTYYLAITGSYAPTNYSLTIEDYY